jgi:hypothetical protein
MPEQLVERIRKVLPLLPDQAPETTETIGPFIKPGLPHISNCHLKRVFR